MKRHPLAWYVLLAYGISWLAVLPLVGTSLGWWQGAVSPSWHALGALGPVAAALIVTGVADGAAGLRTFARGLMRWRIGWSWGAVTLLSPFALFAIATPIARLVGGSWPRFDALPTLLGDPTWLAGLAVAALAYGLGEEPGWRGFLLPRLQVRWPALTSALAVGVVWALWHLPFFFYRFDLGGAGGAAGFVLSMLAGAIWLAFLYNSTGGSVLAVAVWHVLFNVVTVGGASVSEAAVAITSALVIVLAVVALTIGGAARLEGRGDAARNARERGPRRRNPSVR